MVEIGGGDTPHSSEIHSNSFGESGEFHLLQSQGDFSPFSNVLLLNDTQAVNPSNQTIF